MKSRCQIYLNRRFSIKILMLRSNTAHLQSEDESAEPPQEQRARRRVTKKRGRLSSSSFCTQSRGRTGTGVNLLVFETSASTDSAIWASAFPLFRAVQRCKGKNNFLIYNSYLEKILIFCKFIRKSALLGPDRGVVSGVPSHCRTIPRCPRCRYSRSTPECRKRPLCPLGGTSRRSS